MSSFPLPGLEDVPGFLSPESARLLDRLGRWQVTEGIAGDVAEIGVFYGRSALVMGGTLAPGERLIACDSFEVGADDVPGWSFHDPGGPEQSLRRRWEQWLPGRLLVVRRGDSADLTPSDIGAPARLVHVDGGHAHSVALGDLRLATAALGPDGAIVVDDVLLPEWPDVTVALLDHLRTAAGALVPVAVAQHKAVLCRAVAAGRYRAWAAEALPVVHPPPGHLIADRLFDGHPVHIATRLPG